MTFSLLIGNSTLWTVVFFLLVIVAVATQLTKNGALRSLPVFLRALLKAAPAFFLSGLAWQLDQPLIALAFLLCALGDVLLDLPESKLRYGFQLGAVSFAAALVCFSIASYHKPFADHMLLPLSLTNVVIAVFILRWVLPKLTGAKRVLEIFYFMFLIASNVIASTSTVPIFLGSSLWFMSDLSIGLSSDVSDVPANSLDTLGLYDLGLFFLAIGFLNT